MCNQMRQSVKGKENENSVVSRIPQVLFTDLDRMLKPKHQIFKDLGFRTDDFVEIIVVDPWLLIKRAANRISTSIVALKGVLGSVEDISRLLKKCTWFLKTDLDKNLLVNLEYLQKDCGVHPSQIRRFLFNFPRFLLNQPEYIRSIVRRIDEMDFGDKNSGMFLYAIRTMSPMTLENWGAKLKLFRGLGLSDEEISHIFRRSPQVFADILHFVAAGVRRFGQEEREDTGEIPQFEKTKR